MRQPLWFLLVGGLQYALDATLFVALLGLGLATVPANVASRASAAVLGFLANRYLTFGQRSDTFSRFGSSLVRFVLLWLGMTALSSTLLVLVKQGWGAQLETQVVAKLMVEALLAVSSFLLSKYWVFRD